MCVYSELAITSYWPIFWGKRKVCIRCTQNYHTWIHKQCGSCELKFKLFSHSFYYHFIGKKASTAFQLGLRPSFFLHQPCVVCYFYTWVVESTIKHRLQTTVWKESFCQDTTARRLPKEIFFHFSNYLNIKEFLPSNKINIHLNLN